MDNDGSVQSLTRALTLIELLGDSVTGMSIAALSEASDLHKSTVHRLLNTFKARGFVMQDGAGVYRLTFKFCSISRQVINGISLVNVARRHLKTLSDVSRETTYLMMREGGSAVYLHREDCAKTALNIPLSIGKYLPLHVSSAGKSILASLDEREVREYWEGADKKKITENTIDALDLLFAELAATRERGYGVDNEENSHGIRCMGIAIPAIGGCDCAAISIAGLKERMTDARMRELKEGLYRTRDDIMANMGYSII